jgi:hypothetical protein
MRTRSQPSAPYNAAILEDLEWLRFEPDARPVRRARAEPYAALDSSGSIA